MNEIFKIYEPVFVRELLEEMFVGYINSPMCEVGYLGDMYELKRLINEQADEVIKTRADNRKKKRCKANA